MFFFLNASNNLGDVIICKIGPKTTAGISCAVSFCSLLFREQTTNMLPDNEKSYYTINVAVGQKTYFLYNALAK